MVGTRVNGEVALTRALGNKVILGDPVTNDQFTQTAFHVQDIFFFHSLCSPLISIKIPDFEVRSEDPDRAVG